jgi:hypothetical protein
MNGYLRYFWYCPEAFISPGGQLMYLPACNIGGAS